MAEVAPMRGKRRKSSGWWCSCCNVYHPPSRTDEKQGLKREIEAWEEDDDD